MTVFPRIVATEPSGPTTRRLALGPASTLSSSPVVDRGCGRVRQSSRPRGGRRRRTRAITIGSDRVGELLEAPAGRRASQSANGPVGARRHDQRSRSVPVNDRRRRPSRVSGEDRPELVAVLASKTRAVPSLLAVTTCSLSALNATSVRPFTPPERTELQAPVWTSARRARCRPSSRSRRARRRGCRRPSVGCPSCSSQRMDAPPARPDHTSTTPSAPPVTTRRSSRRDRSRSRAAVWIDVQTREPNCEVDETRTPSRAMTSRTRPVRRDRRTAQHRSTRGTPDDLAVGARRAAADRRVPVTSAVPSSAKDASSAALRLVEATRDDLARGSDSARTTLTALGHSRRARSSAERAPSSGLADVDDGTDSRLEERPCAALAPQRSPGTSRAASSASTRLSSGSRCELGIGVRLELVRLRVPRLLRAPRVRCVTA